MLTVIHTYILKYTQLQVEIFRLLCQKAGEKLNQRQIAQFLGVTPRAVAISLPQLIKDDLIVYEKSETMNLIQIYFNSNNKKAVQQKRVDNLRVIYDSQLIEKLESTFENCKIILFGNYSTGQDTSTSDLDIAIIGSDKKDFVATNFEKVIGRKLDLHFYKNYDDINSELSVKLNDGIVLSYGVILK